MITKMLYKLTNRWVMEPTYVQDKLVNHKSRSIETDIVIFSAEKDDTVLCRLQHLFCRQLKHSRLITVADAKHNILNGSVFILQEVYGAIRSFFRS